MDFGAFLIPAAVVAGVALLSSLRILYEYERGVIFRLGKLTRARAPVSSSWCPSPSSA